MVTLIEPTAEREPRRFLVTHNALRGIAAVMVFAYHLQLDPLHRLRLGFLEPLIARGYVWVDFFFLLSGYVLSMAYLARLNGHRFPIGEFLAARAARILPMHLVSLAVLWMLVAALHPNQASLGGAAFWSYLDHTNYVHLTLQAALLQVWNYTAAVSWNVPTWSISAEMHSYLLFAVLASVAARRPNATSVLMVSGSLLIYAFFFATRRNLDILDPMAIYRCAAGFSLGVALQRSRRTWIDLVDTHASALQSASIVGLALVLLSAWHDVFAIPFFALLVAATAGDRGVLSVVLGSRWFRSLGVASYSVYLLSFPVLLAGDAAWPYLGLSSKLNAVRVAGDLMLLTALVAMATLTFHVVEAPARRLLRPRNASRTSSAEASAFQTGPLADQSKASRC